MNPLDKITIETTVKTSPTEAWNAFTSPEAIVRWNQASPDWHCPSAHVDLRKGGQHIARMEARDGSMGFDYAGTYEEVDAPNALTLRLDDERQVRTTFVRVGDGTRVTTTFDPDAGGSPEMQRDGWQAILNSFAAFVDGTGNEKAD